MIEDPKCDTCGAPVTTGAMALICPRREQCEFWNDDCAAWIKRVGELKHTVDRGTELG